MKTVEEETLYDKLFSCRYSGVSRDESEAFGMLYDIHDFETTIAKRLSKSIDCNYRLFHDVLAIHFLILASQTNKPMRIIYLSFFFGRSWFVCPHFFFLQLVARGGRRA